MKGRADVYSPLSDPDTPLEVRMLRIASGALAAQAVYTFASLGMPDLLKSGPRKVADLAGQTGSHADALHRLLRFLATIEVVEESGDSAFALTALGRTLCRQPRSAIRDNTLLVNSPFCWAAIGGLLRQVQTGENAFEHVHGVDFFSYLSQNDWAERAFSAAMDSSTDLGVADVLAMYDFSYCRHVVDAGGGKGALLRAILTKYPEVRGTAYDIEAVHNRPIAADAGVRERLTQLSGSFFEHVPDGADVYILRRVLHDWDDEKALRILRNCRRAMSPSAKLLIIELSPEASRNNWAGLDLLMMVLQNGRERSAEQLQALLSKADMDMTRVLAGKSPYFIVEASTHR
jgi:hypothetical protein